MNRREYNGSGNGHGRPAAAAAGERKPKVFRLHFLAEIEPDLSYEDLIDGLLSATGLSTIYGAPGCGNSFVAVHVGLCVAGGLLFAGRDVEQGGVVYVAAEGQKGMRKRVYAARIKMGVGAAAPFALIDGRVN